MIQYLGHSGFLIPHERAAFLCDPWLREGGAYDGGWFQYPENSHLARPLLDELRQMEEVTCYLSHGHKDHFDPDFLAELSAQRSLQIVIPKFESREFYKALSQIPKVKIVELSQDETRSFGPFAISLLIDDSGLQHDSAILVECAGWKFLNLNDCKCFESLGPFLARNGPIDVFTTQFSGATWHPVCYSYDNPKAAPGISRAKRLSKFRQVAKAISTVKPKLYVNSAGPACFLDNTLFDLNFQKDSIFPDEREFQAYLSRELPQIPFRTIYPGDKIDVPTLEITEAFDRTQLSDKRKYLEAYASRRVGLLNKIKASASMDYKDLIQQLTEELQRKLDVFTLSFDPFTRLLFYVTDAPEAGDGILLNAKNRNLSRVTNAPSIVLEENTYSFGFPLWQWSRLLQNRLTWEDLALTFRARIRRNPDTYSTAVNGFFFCEPEDIGFFCDHVNRIRNNRERIIVKGSGSSFEIDKLCPHQGANLAEGWEEDGCWVCPRHRWKFDLNAGGKCLTSPDTVNSVRVISLEAES